MTKEEKEIIYLLAQKITGAHPDGTFQHEIFITNVEARMRHNHMTSLAEYLNFAKKDPKENAHLISVLSIHTTSWFRENPHYVILQRLLLSRAEKEKPFRMWSAACSTGEEVYSFGVLFEEFRAFHQYFNYSILGTDIDPISLKVAERAVYDKKNLIGPLSFYKKHILVGSGPTEKYFTFSKALRERCEFFAHDIRHHVTSGEPFDLIVCRNVLIYFPAIEVDQIAQQLISHLRPGGHLILGHSELIDYSKMGLTLTGHAVFQKNKSGRARKLSNNESGSSPAPHSPPKVIKKVSPHFKPEIILIGASTGGPQAINAVLADVDRETPPIVVVQHISPQFAPGYAKSLSESTGLKLGSTTDKAKLLPGHLYLADGDYHIGLVKGEDGLVISRQKDAPMNGHRPSVDFLFLSSLAAAPKCLAILLSGMGHDGAEGMLQLHENGAYTLAQAEDDCAVFGMPKEAIERNCVDYIGSSEQLGQILSIIVKTSNT